MDPATAMAALRSAMRLQQHIADILYLASKARLSDSNARLTADQMAADLGQVQAFVAALSAAQSD